MKTATVTQTALEQYFDSILNAAEALYPGIDQARAFRMAQPVREVLEKYNPNYPADTVAPILALHQAVAGYSNCIAPQFPDTHDIGLIYDALPWGVRNKRVKVQADLSIQIGGSIGKDGPYFELSYKNLSLPFEMTLTVWGNLDDVEAHCDGCTQEDRDNGSCNCEPEVAKVVTYTQTEQNRECSLAISEWLSKELGI